MEEKLDLKIKKNRKQSLAKGTFILTFSIFLVKVLGMMFRVFVTGMIGPVGATCFTVAYEIYNPLFALSTAGLPIAVARLVSKNIAMGRYKDVKKIYKVSVPMFFYTGLIGMFLMILASFFVPNLMNIPDAKYAIIALSPTILFACLMSIYRGYHQGLRNVVPTAVSEIIEASCKFFIGFLFSFFIIDLSKKEFLQKGTFFGFSCSSLQEVMKKITPLASAGAILGVTIGSMLGFLFLYFTHKKIGSGFTKEDLLTSPDPESKKNILKSLFKTAVPIGAGSIFFNIASFIDVTLILKRIRNVMLLDPDTLLSQYKNIIPSSNLDNVHGFLLGCFSFTMPLVMMIPAITQGLGTVSLPAVTRAFTKKDTEQLKKSVESVIKMTLLFTVPAGIFVSVLGPNLLKLIYPHRPEAVFVASKVIPLLGIATIFQACSLPVTSMLQAVGRVDLPLKIVSLGLILKIIVNYIFVGIPRINIGGAGLGTFVGYLFILIVSLFMLLKKNHIKPDFSKTFFMPLVAACSFGVSLVLFKFLFYRIFNNLFTVFISLFASLTLYFVFLVYLKIVAFEEIKKIPFIGKFFH